MTERTRSATSPAVAKRDVIADQIRSRVLSGDLKPGDRLREEDVAREYGASRVPVREALARLQSDGFVTLTPFRGATVAAPSPVVGLELMQIRRGLESVAVRLAAQRRGGDVVEAMKEVVERGTVLAARGDFSELPAAIQQFHILIAQASGNHELQQMLAHVREQIIWTFEMDLEMRAHSSWVDHAEILAAVIAGFEDLSVALMDRHLAVDEAHYRAHLDEAQSDR